MENKPESNRRSKIILLISILLFRLLPGNILAQEKSIADFNGTRSIMSIDSLLHNYLYDAEVLDSPEFLDIQRKIENLGNNTKTKNEFIDGFNNLWQDGPFSHVMLTEARQSAGKLADYLDKMNVEGKGAELSWKNDIAILTVNTMMGLNTIDQINDAFEEIAKKNSAALIIDLRKNGGGAFAVKPLIGHLIDKEYDAGIFVSNKWTKNNKGLPSSEYINSLEPWKGWSIKSFWNDAQEKGVLRISVEPMQPIYTGPVYLLISNRTASAAELASDILLTSGRATLVGEKTKGAMLSQKMYDLPQGLQLSLPIADYYSLKSGRIEGNGVNPNIEIKAEKAMNKVVEMIKLNLEKNE